MFNAMLLIIKEETYLLIILILLLLVLVTVSIYYLYYKNKNIMFGKLFKKVPSGLFMCDKDDALTIVYCSNSFLSLIGYTLQEFKAVHNSKLINLICKEDLGAALKSMYEQLSEGDSFEIKVRIIKKGDVLDWVMCRGVKCSFRKGTYYSCVMENITDYVINEDKLKIDEERYRIIAESSDSVIFEHNLKLKSIYYTNKYKYKFGEEPLTENFPDSFIAEGKIHSEDVKKYLLEYNKILSGNPSGNIEVRIKKSDGEYIWCNLRYTSIFSDSGEPIKVIGKIIDVDKIKRETEYLKKANQLDSFTGLYNKTSILKLIEEHLNSSTERKHALFFLDIDNFKFVNDTYGHLFGDAMLSNISETIKNQFRHRDLIGRIGGDEFLILVKDYVDENFIVEKSRALLSSIENMKNDGIDFPITASLGVALYPKDGLLLTSLYKKADVALYAAKNEGKNKFRLYSKGLNINQYLNDHSKIYSGIDVGINRFSIQDYVCFLYELSEYGRINPTQDGINGILSMYGCKFKSDRVYVFEFNASGNTVTNTHEWCKNKANSKKEICQNIPFSRADYEKHYNDGNVFIIKNSNDREIIVSDTQDIATFIHCKIIKDGVLKGFVGFDICEKSRLISREEVDTLVFISKMLENRK